MWSLGEFSDSAKRAESANGSFLKLCRQRTIWSLGEFSDSAKRAESANGSFLRVCRQRTIWSLGEFSDSAKKAESATGSFLRVCRQRATWSLGQDLRSQTLPRKQNRRMGVFSESADSELRGDWGEFSDSARTAEPGWGFSQSVPTELRCHWASSQTLPRKQNRRLGVFSESADSELRGDWGEISDSAKRAESANGSFLKLCRQRTMW